MTPLSRESTVTDHKTQALRALDDAQANLAQAYTLLRAAAHELEFFDEGLAVDANRAADGVPVVSERLMCVWRAL